MLHLLKLWGLSAARMFTPQDYSKRTLCHTFNNRSCLKLYRLGTLNVTTPFEPGTHRETTATRIRLDALPQTRYIPSTDFLFGRFHQPFTTVMLAYSFVHLAPDHKLVT